MEKYQAQKQSSGWRDGVCVVCLSPQHSFSIQKAFPSDPLCVLLTHKGASSQSTTVISLLQYTVRGLRLYFNNGINLKPKSFQPRGQVNKTAALS